jgi:deoxyribonuclease-4
MEAYMLMKENNINLEDIIVHAPYIINLANNSKKDNYNFAISFLTNEIERCEMLGITKLVLHPGSFVTLNKQIGMKNIIKGLNNILTKDQSVIILLETMAGKGTEIGTSFEEIKEIIDGVELSSKLGVCLDTCHLNDSGYDISEIDKVLDKFDKLIGIDKIGCVHLNDSKNEINTHKDRHANIGLGSIGFDSLANVLYNKRLENIPFILETPYIDKLYAPYKEEIKMLRNKKINKNIIDDIKKK